MTPSPEQTATTSTAKVVELRVHGVSGTPVESMLDDPHPAQVSGDDSGRIFRANPRPAVGPAGIGGRTVEAYHWGRYTAGSPARALWLLLAPFALVNVARFALLMPRRRGWRDRFADLVLRMLGLVLTGTLVITACYIAWEVAARQCAAADCAADTWWMRWFADRSDGVRVLTAGVVPAAVIALIWTFGRQSFTYDPPGPRVGWTKGTNGSFDDPGFWRGAAQASRQRAAHVWLSCAVLASLALSTLGWPGDWWNDARLGIRVGYGLLVVLTTVGAVTALVVVVGNVQPASDELVADESGRETIRLPPWMGRLRWTMAVVGALCVLLAAWGQDHLQPNRTAGSTVFEYVVAYAGLVSAALLVLLTLACAIMAFTHEPGERLRRGGTQPEDGGTYPVVPRAFRPFFFGFGASVVAALAVTVAFGFSTAAVFWTAKALGRPVLRASPVAGTRVSDQQIELADGYWSAAAIWGVLAVIVAVIALPVTAWAFRRNHVVVCVLVAAATATVIRATLVYDGDDPVRDQAEFYLIAGVLVTVAAFLCAFGWRKDGFDELIEADYAAPEVRGRKSSKNDETQLALNRHRAKVARQWRMSMARYRYHHAAGTLAVLGGLAVLASAAVTVPFRTRPSDETLQGTLGTVGVVVVTAIATGLVALGVLTWRNPKMRTAVGIVWDLLSFWPRTAHPLCPPPYGGRAVLAVAKRCTELVTLERADKVVLSGHSQGSVITLAACAVVDGQTRDTGGERWIDRGGAERTKSALHMLTYGSQLQFIYARMFPTYLGYFRLRWIYEKALAGRWRNLYRWTDPLGGPVLSWPADTKDRPSPGPGAGKTWTYMSCGDGCPGHPPRAHSSPHGDTNGRHWTIGPDIRFRDPTTITESAYEPRLPARAHSDYPADPAYDSIVCQLVDGGGRPPRCPQAPPAVQCEPHRESGRP